MNNKQLLDAIMSSLSNIIGNLDENDNLSRPQLLHLIDITKTMLSNIVYNAEQEIEE